MNKISLTTLAFAVLAGAAFAADDTASGERPTQCQTFGISSFGPLDTNNDRLLSDSEFQVHRDQMHGDDVPAECHIPYDKGSYERLSGKKGMNKSEFKVHLEEMRARAKQGNDYTLQE